MRIAAVVVTYNRLALLKKSLEALKNQTRQLDEIIVINNGCTDGSCEWLAEQKTFTVIAQENSGSSGGQYTGIKTAYKNGHDWIWCMDDDTIPKYDALEKLIATPYFNQQSSGFLSSKVVWTDNQFHKMNMPSLRSYPANWLETVLIDQCVEIVSASFVSLLISRQAVNACGLPIREMFIWSDDVEYTQRISRSFRGYLVLNSIAVHKTPTNEGVSFDNIDDAKIEKYYYGIRNNIYLYKKTNCSHGILRHYRMFRYCLGLFEKIRRHKKTRLRLLTAIKNGILFDPPVINRMP